ncbi:MAG: enoyl-CoA hydratase [Pseudomonadota bacterium]
MSYNTIIWGVADGVARITLNRPENANALNLEMCQELMRAAIQCDEDPAIRAVILTATGKMFCAGGDLAAFGDAGDNVGPLLKEMTTNLHAASSRFMRMDPPLIVAVNGTAAGGGMSLAISGDIVLSAESAKFTMAYTNAGLSPDGTSSYFLPRLIGLRRTQELMLTNRVLSAQEAQEWGVITQSVPDDQLMAEAEKLAKTFAKGPTRAYGAVKFLLSESYDNALETQTEWESRKISEMGRSEDGKAGIAAFLEKRKPEFHGK